MVNVIMRAVLVTVGLLGVNANASGNAAPLPVPTAAFAALPQVSQVTLSPDGRLLAWRDRSGPQPKVMVLDIAAKSYRQTLGIGPGMELRSLGWADDATLLINLSQVRTIDTVQGLRSYTYFRTVSVDIASGRSQMLLMSGGAREWVTGADLVASHTTKPHTVIMSTWDYSSQAAREQTGTHIFDPGADSGWISELFQVDTMSGKGTLIDEGDQYWAQWVVDPDGTPLARSEWRHSADLYIVEARTAGGWRHILERPHGEEWTLNGRSSDGKSIIATGPSQNGRVTLWAIALDGSGAKDLLPDASADVADVIVDRFTGVPMGVDLAGLNSTVRWLDAAAQQRGESIARAFPGRETSVYTHSLDGSRVLVEIDDRSHPPIYYLVDFKTHRADIVGEAYPGLDNVTLGAVRTITYAAHDGTAIPAYLTLPPGMVPKGLPMVVLPHGGPEANDDDSFDWLAQFLATRGYAVLQPEFRGSTGFGEAFRNAGRGQWGGLMQDDVTDGVKAIIREGIADPRRICIVGANYGGYAALAGAAFTPHLYACAVSINGISDLPGFLSYEKDHSGPESQAVAYLRTEVGSAFDRKVIDRSPAHAAAAIEVPVLLFHAVDDTFVPIAQSQKMQSALASLGKPVTLVKLPGDDWLSKVATRLEVLEDMDRFLRQYLQ